MHRFLPPTLFALLLPIFLWPGSAAAGSPADVVLLNGAVYTVNSAQPWATALALRSGEITFVGIDIDAQAHVGPSTQVIDLDGKMVLPGFHDSHVHLLEAHHEALGTCLLNSGISPEAQITVIQNCAPHQVGTDWVLGFGHSIYDLLDHIDFGGRLPIDILDDAVPNRPAVMMEELSHSVWANSAALAAAGIDASTPDPVGGVIGRDPSTGEPNGILFEAAGEILMDMALAPNAVLEELNYEGLLAGLDLVRRHGITSVVDARAYWKRGYVEAWQRAQEEDALTARSIVSLWAYPSENDAQQIAALASMYSNDPEALLRFSQVKIYADGEIWHTTAALLQPYLCCAQAGPTGLEVFSESRLQHYIEQLEPVGFDFHIHAIGDRGVHQALNAIEQGSTGVGRHRLTHVELVQPSDLPRFAQLDITADLQMSHQYVMPPFLGDNAFLLGSSRIAERTWQLRGLHEAGARVVLSSDYDVGDISPLEAMQRSLTRGDQSLPNLDAAIRAYTLNAAYLMRQESRVGSLEIGKLADLVILDRNLFDFPSAQIGDAQVVATILEGRTIWGGIVLEGGTEIFSDGFESGDSAAWSAGSARLDLSPSSRIQLGTHR